ncbi:family 43 glycosylhydrolase [Nocardioides iriomotensis]|uniref:Arabinan endo-1,5-alpha-L-arabinosidase n=1 Tax=Nocardioides iriomotensis TaxID=715784 RepID=A0A4Q5JAT3_9ACTN|nr:family 43 glycosylhydrolase [Nocardioides iriomotensis]RYU15773.1 arabinan endo-1,5-alpha-L-arabinosidase [Nocardioides iriomotensis]
MTRVTPLSAVLLLAPLLAVGAATPATSATAETSEPPPTYSNPLAPTVADGGTVDSCADPAVLQGQGDEAGSWYLYCTTDPLNDAETSGPGDPVFHPVPTMRSDDLVSWEYVGDALPQRPAWAAPSAFLWAPDVVHSRTHDRYYLTYVVTDTADAVSGEPGCTSDSAIGVAVSDSPTGPWTPSDEPLVGPRRAGPGCDFYWTYDPDVLGDSVDDTAVLYFGSYYGGVFGQHVALTADGISTTGQPTRVTLGQRVEPKVDPADLRRPTQPDLDAAEQGAATQVSIGNRYEGTNVVRRGDWYYLFGSATNCCAGPLTGYTVFAGRSRSPLGPFVDREGSSLLAGRVGGTPVISMNGNRWVGTGHSSAFRDTSGRWWLAYHAVDRDDPYFAGRPGFTKRPALLDPLAWVDGWPSVRSGRWASDEPVPGPAAQPGQVSAYRPDPVDPDRTGRLLPAYSDEFGGERLADRWTWVRRPDPATYRVAGGRFRFATQAADLYVDSNTASVLTEPAPTGDYVVQTKVSLDVPAEGCCHNYVQAGLVVRRSDDAFVKLGHASIWETRQTEWAKEVPAAPPSFPRYGNSVVGAPGDETWLRIVRRTRDGAEHYTAYTSQGGRRWVRGGVWTHELGPGARIGLVSMGGAGFTATFDHVRVWRLE